MQIVPSVTQHFVSAGDTFTSKSLAIGPVVIGGSQPWFLASLWEVSALIGKFIDLFKNPTILQFIFADSILATGKRALVNSSVLEASESGPWLT